MATRAEYQVDSVGVAPDVAEHPLATIARLKAEVATLRQELEEAEAIAFELENCDRLEDMPDFVAACIDWHRAVKSAARDDWMIAFTEARLLDAIEGYLLG